MFLYKMKMKCRLCELTSVNQQQTSKLSDSGLTTGVATAICTHDASPVTITPAALGIGQLYHFAGFMPQLRDMMLAACLFRGYYQPAGPLITAHHGHTHPAPVAAGKAAQAPVPSPSPTPPPPLPTTHQPPPSSTGTTDSSDNEVIITSSSTASEPVPVALPPPAAQTYRYTTAQYPPPAAGTHHAPPGYSYSYPPSQYYQSTAPAGFAHQQHYHHDICYPGTSYPAGYLHPKTYATTFRRYLPPPPPAGPQYYPSNPELYAAPSNAQSSQVVSASSGTGGSNYQPPPTGPPPPTLVESYAGPPPPPVPPTIVEPYPPPHYYSYGTGPAPPACYTHSPPTRNLAFIDAAYQSCPCPMQSCPKNVHTGPLTGDGKRSNVTVIAKESMPLPPVALALPLEPASVQGPPSPARGSAGMPPPPSPAGATYQPTSASAPTTAAAPKWDTKQEESTETMLECKISTNPSAVVTEKRTKARLGKTMARNQLQQQQTPAQGMLLMCHNPPQQQITIDTTSTDLVKREVESPEEIQMIPEQKHERLPNVEKMNSDEPPNQIVDSNNKIENEVQNITEGCNKRLNTLIHNGDDDVINQKLKNEEEDCCITEENDVPVVVQTVTVRRKSIVADDIKTCHKKTEPDNDKVNHVINIPSIEKASLKRKHINNGETLEVQAKKQKPNSKTKAINGSYKDLIKKNNNNKFIKINNGKRKLNIDCEIKPVQKKILLSRTPKIMLDGKNKKTIKRKQQTVKEEPSAKKAKTSKPLVASNLHNSKQNVKQKIKKAQVIAELTENKEPVKKTGQKKTQVNSKCNNNILNNVDRTIESVISSARVLEDSLRTSVKQVTTATTTDRRNNNVTTTTTTTTTDSKPITDCAVKQHTNTTTRVNNHNNKVTKMGSGRCGTSKKKSKTITNVLPLPVPRIPRKSIHAPRWSNGWAWEGEPFPGKVFLNSDEALIMRKCYPAMRHTEGDVISPRDCVLLKAGPRKIDLPFVAKVAALWEDEDGEMMMSLLWYYRPEHTEQGRRPVDRPDEVFASRHKDTNSVACIEDKCYVLTFNEYCRYRKTVRRLEDGMEHLGQVVPLPEGGVYYRENRQPPAPLVTAPDLVFFCRQVYDFRQKRIVKNPS